jgi:hypothetical protein
VKSLLEEFSDPGREVMKAIAPIVLPNMKSEQADPEWGRTVLCAGLIALIHYSKATEVDFERELRTAREWVAEDLEIELDLQSDGGDA